MRCSCLKQQACSIIVRLLFCASACWHLVAAQQASSVAAVQLLQNPIRIVADVYDDDPTAVCSTDNFVSVAVDALLTMQQQAAPRTVVVSVSLAYSQLLEATVFSTAGLNVVLFDQSGWIVVYSATGLARYRWTSGMQNPVVLSLAINGQQHRLCINLACALPAQASGVQVAASGWVFTTVNNNQGDVTFGSPTGKSMAGTVQALWVLPGAVAFDSLATAGQTVADVLAAITAPAAAVPPTVSLQVQTAAPVVGQPVSVAVSATGSAGVVRVRLTFWGAVPSDCAGPSCGSRNQTLYSSTASLQETVLVTYDRAGRYTIRVQAADDGGGWASQDVIVLVRKVGDSSGSAACCRSTGLIIAQQLGRPIDPTTFRPSWLTPSAAAVGWEGGYLQGPEDLEAERLFDYTLLAPLNTGPIQNLTCADRHLAGLASPKVAGVDVTPLSINANSNQGHNKRIAILPQGFNWATTTAWSSSRLPTCVRFWTDWPSRSPYAMRQASSWCSYTCTPDGVQELATLTGTMDRWSEAVIENTYGRVSLLPQPVVLPILYMPKDVAGGLNSFTYSESLVQQHLQSLGYDMYRDFHTIVVLSPLPQFINPGNTAWANGGGSPMIYVMRCNPQHYYLLHEIGHRFGMPHATIYKLANETATAMAPTTKLLAAGTMDDAYTDRLDIMACCKGDYSLYNRILAGWVPGSERVTLGLSDMSASSSSGPVTRRYTLWPYDRPESKGQLKGVTLRIEDGKVLVLGYRSLPFWQDVRIKDDGEGGKPHAPEHMRDNLHGLSIEYARRTVGSWGSSAWSARGLLDFNMAFARYPSALPRTAGSFPSDPPGAAFTLLREGDAWLDQEHNLLLAVERLVPCEGGNLPVHRYSVYNFYGFRGENPGQEAVRRADYTGYAGALRCLQLRVVTGVTQSPGTLDVKLRLQGLDVRNRLVLGGQQCGFPIRPQLRVDIPSGVDVVSIVWRNNLNQTVAVDSKEVELPPLQPLDEASASSTEQCNAGCDWRYHVKVLSSDGAQTEVSVSVGSVSLSSISLTATYRYYLASSILTAVKYHAVPVLPLSPTRTGAAEGRSLLVQPVTLQAAAAMVFSGSSLPDFSCSRQWSLSLNLRVPASAVASPGPSSTRLTPLLAVLAGGSSVQGWPSVWLKVSAAGTALVVQWGNSAAREQAVSINPNRDGWASVHLAVVHDDSRLGVWLDSSGSWLLEDVNCVPASTALRYCTQPTDPAADSSFRALRLGAADGPAVADISITSARVYNYALPRLSLASESGCVDDGSCGRFLLAGWAPPVASSIPAGSISGSSVEAVASTPIQLRATSFYLLVSPWSPCSARCGGGWSNREVRCMKLGSRTVEVPIEDCPLGEEIPATNKRCNTVACPTAAFQVLSGQHSACRTQSCNLLPSPADGAQLACVNSVGQPLLAGRCCCQLCNASDWSDISWSNNLTDIQQSRMPVTVGSTVTLLSGRLTVSNSSGSTTSFRDAFLSADLPAVCQADQATCTQPVRWQLGSWGTCSSSCGGGVSTRTAACINADIGDPVIDSQCAASLGQVPVKLLSRPCNQQPCAFHAWQVGQWSTCGGDSAYGHSSRPVTCVDTAGSIVNPSSSTCPSAQPASKVMCLTETTNTACRPSFLADWYFKGQDCYGHGLCGAAGCECKDGWRGQFCEVSPSCKGVMDRHDRCCASGVLNVTGECCATGAVLDATGACCASGQVDVCGVCEGSSWTVDIRGVCCASVLDAYGLCCTSGAVDECGMCDGDGTSCSLHLRLLVRVPQGSDIISTGTPLLGGLTGSSVASTQLTAWAQAAIQQAAVQASLGSSTQLQLQAEQVSAKWAAALAATTAGSNSSSDVNPVSRHLLTAAVDADSSAAPPSLCFAIPPSSNAEGDRHLSPDGVQCPSPTPTGSNTQHEAAPAAPALGRRLHQTAGGSAAGGDALVELDVVLMPSNVLQMIDNANTSQQGSSSAGLLGVGQLLASGLEQQAASSSSGSSGSGPQLLRVMLAERVGVCGNGLCEVGERPLLNSEGDVLQEAPVPCVQDCPGSFQLCPAPVGPVGDPDRECGGNGRCIRTTGTCDCNAGYTGAACEFCLASFYQTAARSCIPQYISGKNIFNPIETEPPLTGWALALVIIAGLVTLTILVGMAVTLWNWLVHGVPPKTQLDTTRKRIRAWWEALVMFRVRALLRRLPKVGAAKQAGVSKKYLLDEELELAGGAGLKTKGRFTTSDGGVVESPALRQRRISAESSVEQGDLLKAVRAGQSTPGSSQQHSQRHSSASGASPPSSAALQFSSDGGRGSSRFGAASPLARVLSGMAVSIQRGVSGAGGAVARTLSGAGLMPLSQHGSAGYERIIDMAGGSDMALPVSQQGGSPDGRSGRSRLGAVGADQLQLQHSAPQPSRFFLPGVSALPADGSAQSAGLSSPTAARQLSPRLAAGWAASTRPVPGAASLQGPEAQPEPAEGLLPRPPGLARIRTRPRERSGTGGQGGAAAGQPLQAAPMAMQAPVAGSTGPMAPAAAAASPGSDGAQGAGAAEGSSSRRWRTRQDYQADLVAASSPISLPRREQQGLDRRAPSEPGLQGTQRVRGHAGLNFVQTPTATDATNRNMIEAFGQRMELWFSPRNPHSSTGSGSHSGSGTGSGSGSGSFSGVLAQFAALRGAQPAAQHTASHLAPQRHQQQGQQQQEHEEHKDA